MKNYDLKIKNIENQIKDFTVNYLAQIKELKQELVEARKFTQIFLNECGKQGIKRVSIGVVSDKVPATKGWNYPEGSVFQFPSGKKGNKVGSWVAIWDVVEKLGISGGCGNGDQHQVANDNLVEGVFELKGKMWRKI
jgi:hypothetical protein